MVCAVIVNPSLEWENWDPEKLYVIGPSQQEAGIWTWSLRSQPFPFIITLLFSLNLQGRKGQFTPELKTVDEVPCWGPGSPDLGTSPTWVYYMITGESPLLIFCTPAGSPGRDPYWPVHPHPLLLFPFLLHFRITSLPLVPGAHLTSRAVTRLSKQFLLPAMLLLPSFIWTHSSSLYLDVTVKNYQESQGGLIL